MKDKKTSILGVGIDMEEIGRFQKLPFHDNKIFYEKIFTPKEIAYCLRMGDPYQHFAARFCAKEAVVKALPDSGEIMSYKSIEVIKKSDKPEIKIEGYDNLQIYVSLSHAMEHAIALVVIEKS